MKRSIFTVFLLLVIACGFGQSPLTVDITTTVNRKCKNECVHSSVRDVIINEIALWPEQYNGSLYGDFAEMRGQWLELYNTNACDPVDISCWFVANNEAEYIINGTDEMKDFAAGFVVPPGTVIPPNGFLVIRGINAEHVPADKLVKNGGKTLEIVLATEDNLCIEEGVRYSRRFFMNYNGGWIALYDNKGVPRDACRWTNEDNSCLSCSPCTPIVNGCDYTGRLKSYSEISPALKATVQATQMNFRDHKGKTFGRMPDGSDWAKGVPLTPTIGTCNSTCAEPPQATGNGTATAEAAGGTPPYQYQWDDPRAQTARTATNLAAGTYTVTVTDALGRKTTQTCTIEDFKPTITVPDTGYCYTTELIELTGALPEGGIYSGDHVSNNKFLDISEHQNSYDVSYTFTDSMECANTVTFPVKVYDVYQQTIRDTVCQGEPYTENNFNIDGTMTSMSGLVRDTLVLTSIQHCDSIVDLELTVLPTYEISVPVDICEGETYTWNGHVIGDSLTAEPGIYECQDTLHTIFGCDSIVALHLNIRPKYETHISDAVCEGEAYNRHGFSIAPSQTLGVEDSLHQTLTLRSAYGCDSIVILSLYVVDTALHVEQISPEEFCTVHYAELSATPEADSYQWNTGETSQSITARNPGVFTVTAYRNPCQMKASYHIANCPFEMYLPNAITPGNADGLNDCLGISEVQAEQIDQFEISIYNRWGEIVFMSKDKFFKWDGKCNGKLYKNVVYNYIIRCTDYRGVEYAYQGSVVVL